MCHTPQVKGYQRSSARRCSAFDPKVEAPEVRKFAVHPIPHTHGTRIRHETPDQCALYFRSRSSLHRVASISSRRARILNTPSHPLLAFGFPTCRCRSAPISFCRIDKDSAANDACGHSKKENDMIYGFSIVKNTLGCLFVILLWRGTARAKKKRGLGV